MKANELRIGNLVTVNNPESHPKLKGIVLEVTSIHESGNREGYTHGVGLKHINQMPNKYYETYSQFVRFIEPIPLTEEWLTNFVFEKSVQPNGAIFYGMLRIPFRFTENKRGEFYLFGYEYPVKIEYVHQLQNLYFALTGSELTIKE